MVHPETSDPAITGHAEDAPAHVPAMDQQADREITAWSRGALAASLLPPPYELAALTAALQRMGHAVAGIYHQQPTSTQLKPLAKAIAHGLLQAAPASPGRTCVLGEEPGIRTWALPTIRPELASDIACSAGHAFKPTTGS